jgi:hypothetical protein
MESCEVAPQPTRLFVPRRANYGFEKRQKELKRQKKKEEKEAKRRAKRETDAGAEPSDVTPTDELTSVRSPLPDADEETTP